MLKGAMKMDLLEVKGLSISFGGLKAVQDVSFSVPKGKIVSVIGPNGAGKTTIFNMLTGFYQPDAGSIKLDGVEMVGKKHTNSSAAASPAPSRISGYMPR